MEAALTPQVLEEFDGIMRHRRLRTLLQPVVDLRSSTTVGYEALIRGPRESSLASPDALLATAYRTGRVVEFDWAARAAACRDAAKAGLAPETLLFLNIEPVALDSTCPPEWWPDINRAYHRYRIVLEVTERSLEHDPGRLLDALDRIRPTVEGIALDDVGSRPTTVALLPLVAPSVIKLDKAVTQGGVDPGMLDLVSEESQRTGAVVLAEGIEKPTHVAAARFFGASLGQGHLLGRPTSQPDPAAPPSFRLQADTPVAVTEPFEALTGLVTGLGTETQLRRIGRYLLKQLKGIATELCLVYLPADRLLRPGMRGRLVGLAHRGVLTAMAGPGIAEQPGDGIRGSTAPAMAGQWALVLLGPGYSAALLARRSPGPADGFEFAIVHDRRRVIAAARCLLRRISSLPTDPGPRSDEVTLD